MILVFGRLGVSGVAGYSPDPGIFGVGTVLQGNVLRAMIPDTRFWDNIHDPMQRMGPQSPVSFLARNPLGIPLDSCIQCVALRTVTPHTRHSISYYPPLNHHQGLIHCDSRVFSPQRWGQFGVAAVVDTDGCALSASWLSAPLLTSHKRILGSGSEIGGIEPRSIVRGLMFDEKRRK